jgi:Ser/Thr protein kinase RdoA (MazF antagonist)
VSETEEPMFGGLANARVFRVGNTVRRPAGDWTPTVHALLQHLQGKGFPAPKPMGLDDKGREIVSYLPGEAGLRPWPAALLETSGVRDVGALLRAYHDAVRDFAPPAPAIWRHGPQELGPGEIALHGDFGPYNLIWNAGRLTGVIDFELARPGAPLEDAAFSVMRVAHLRPDALAQGAGFTSMPDRRGRLNAFAEGYGCDPDDLLARTRSEQLGEIERMVRLGGRGRQPWTSFLARGLEARAREELRWLDDNLGKL